MYNDTWMIRWKGYLSDSYAFGSKIEFRDDMTVAYDNPLMPPGTVIHRWRSRSNFQMNHVEALLPLIDGEAPYELSVNVHYMNENLGNLMLRIVFYDRYDAEVSSITIRRPQAVFLPPIQTYSYCIELINGGRSNFVFESLILREASKEELQVYDERIEQDKTNTKKGKKRRKKNSNADK